MTIKAGDVVRLKAGGPNMTVERVAEERAACVWFKSHAGPRPARRMGRCRPLDFRRGGPADRRDAAGPRLIGGARLPLVGALRLVLDPEIDRD